MGLDDGVRDGVAAAARRRSSNSRITTTASVFHYNTWLGSRDGTKMTDRNRLS